jgi:LPXTG-motif cell wall-anchored protein
MQTDFETQLKIGVLAGSLIAGTLGVLIVRRR